MFKQALLPVAAAAAILGTSLAAGAQPTSPTQPPSTTAPIGGQNVPANGQQMGETPVPRAMMTAAPAGGMSPSGTAPHTMMTSAPAGSPSTGGAMPGGNMGSMHGEGSMHGMRGMMTGPDHGMPEGMAGGDGVTYTGAPDLQGAISLVTAGGAPGNFSIVTALTHLAGAKVATAELAKLTKQYGKAKIASFVAVQNFAVNDAVKIATAAGVKFPAPMLHGAALASHVVKLGLVNGTYYEGTQLDHLVSNKIHEAVMDDIDAKFGVTADANYHLIANQAHYDLAQALGAKSVKLAPFH